MRQLQQRKDCWESKPVQITKKYLESRRYEMDAVFNNIKADLQELADYFCPRAVRFLVDDIDKPLKRNKKILDSTPLIAIRNFSSGMATGATSPTLRWFKINVRNKKLKKDYFVKKWCADVENLLRDIFNSSPLYICLPDVYSQMGIFLFSALAFEKDYENVIHCKVLPMGSYRYAKDEKGRVNALVREYKETARNILKKFGEKNCSHNVKEAAKNKPLARFSIVHIVIPNPNHKINSPRSSDKKFLSVYYEVAGENEKFLEMGGFDIFPYVIFECKNNGEDTYPSDGPGINALSDVRQLMSLVKEYAKAVKKIVSPAYKGPSALKNKRISDVPGAFVEEDDNGRGLSPIYEVNPRVLELKAEKDDTKQTIKEHFYNDLFAMILNTAERGRTATEVNELKEEKMVLLSPLLMQIYSSLRQIIEITFYYCIQFNLVPEPPQQLKGENMEIEFVSILAQALKAQNIASMERFTTFTINLANTIDPTLKYKINGCQMIDDYADFANIDPAQIQPTENVEAIKQQIMEQEQTQQLLNQAAQGSEVIKNVGGADAFGGELMSRLGFA